MAAAGVVVFSGVGVEVPEMRAGASAGKDVDVEVEVEVRIVVVVEKAGEKPGWSGRHACRCIVNPPPSSHLYNSKANIAYGEKGKSSMSKPQKQNILQKVYCSLGRKRGTKY